MKPIGLTMKKGRNKYRREAGGELMLIHQCVECQTLSINRIAADDDSEKVLAIFEQSLFLSSQAYALCQSNGIVMLDMEDRERIRTQLYGHRIEFPALNWA
jgi:hypothetical protein